MSRADRPAEAQGSEELTCQLEWRADDTVELTATADDPAAILRTGLRCVLAAVRGRGAHAATAEHATAAVPIRGQGADLPRVFAELAADLLAQLDANGPGLDDVRLDGLLTTDEGGYTAWGYAVGAVTDNPPPVGVSLDGEPNLTTGEDGRLILRCTLRRT